MTIQKPIAALKRQAEKRNESIEGGSTWRMMDFVLYLLLTMLAVFALRSVLIDPVRVNGTSMLDTLSDGEIMMVDRLAYTFKEPKIGDVVVCYYPDASTEMSGKSYHTRVKRVAACGGDTIEAHDGTVYVNGVALSEPYLTKDRIGTLEIEKQVVPEGYCYILGDNRAVSIDSRSAAVGPIPLQRIVGKVRMVLYPFTQFRKV